MISFLMMEIAGVVLAGGSNRRFPILKGLMEVEGERVIDRNLRLLRRFFSQVLISTNRPDAYFYTGAQLVGDLYPSIGPLVGICSSLITSEADALCVMACDMPFVRPELIDILIKSIGSGDAVIFEHSGRLHPLLGIYRASLIPLMEQLINQKDTEMIGFIRQIECRIIGEAEFPKLSGLGRSFVNINTPEEYRRYKGG